ncbi:MAG: extracellular elastinolytic metalloproteinase, partial [Bacteroidia bacterium]
SPIPVTGKLVLVDDGTTNGSEGCNSLINSGAVSGNIAIIDRGNCNFDIKVKNAQDAGAVAVIMVNNVGSGVLIMAGNDPSINIPQIMISLPDGNVIKNKMTTADVFVSMYDSSTAGTFYYDSDFDNGIIAHEYTHGISTRLTGGSANSGCLQNTEQMGEGWSDFLGLIMSHEPGDKPEDFRGIGTYVTNESTTGGGIRPYPYSTDLSINPVTYDYIKQNQFTAPHGVGSVWCSMLWDLYWTFIDKYGYDPDIYEGTGGNNMVMHLVMDGLKLQPCGPGFTDGRDAILKADELRYGGNNKELIWQTFADRGLGYSADQGSTDSKTDGTQAFDMPPSFGGYSIDKVGPITANAGDTINYSVTVTNIGGETLNSLTLKDNLSAFGTFYQSDGQCAITFVNNSFTFSFADLKNGEQITCGYSAIVSSEAGGKLISLDDMETVNSDWIVTSVVGSDRWSRTTAAASSGITSWFASDPNAESDQNLQKEFDLTEIAKPYLVFNHFYNTEERWDGGVVEIRINGSWIDLGSKMIQNGYNQAIEQNPASRISGRNAFTGNSVDFITTVVDLTQYAGNVANIRFRMVSDALQDAEGWYVDDVALWNGFGSLTNVASVEGDGLKPQTDQVITSITNNDIKDTVVIIVVDINEKFAVYPNPVGAVVNVKFESKIDRNLGLKIINLHGQTVWTGNLAANTKGFYIPVKNYASGYYLLEVMDGEDVRYVRLLKE